MSADGSDSALPDEAMASSSVSGSVSGDEAVVSSSDSGSVSTDDSAEAGGSSTVFFAAGGGGGAMGFSPTGIAAVIGLSGESSPFSERAARSCDRFGSGHSVSLTLSPLSVFVTKF